jgi:hypothetical protein
MKGYTDAEVYYESHFTHRPVSDLSGYYELRDSRGDSMSNFLDYDSATVQGVPTINLWGKSRWGMFHLTWPGLSGSGVDFARNGSRYSGGFTPVDNSQR